MVTAIVRDYLQRKHEQAATKQTSAVNEPSDTVRKPIWERILERSAAIPDEEWEKLASRWSRYEQHDHYIYGVPKRQTAHEKVICRRSVLDCSC